MRFNIKFLFIYILLIYNIPFVYADNITENYDLGFIIKTHSNSTSSKPCHGFFLDNHTIVIPNNCFNTNINTVYRYLLDNNKYLLQPNGLLLKSAIKSKYDTGSTLLSTKKYIFLDSTITLGSLVNKKIVIPVTYGNIISPMDAIFDNGTIKLLGKIENNCKIINGTPILSFNKGIITIVSIFEKDFLCNNKIKFNIKNNSFISNINSIYPCFTYIEGYRDVSKTQSNCNFRYSS
jgi:hypothetical protein